MVEKESDLTVQRKARKRPSVPSRMAPHTDVQHSFQADHPPSRRCPASRGEEEDDCVQQAAVEISSRRESCIAEFVAWPSCTVGERTSQPIAHKSFAKENCVTERKGMELPTGLGSEVCCSLDLWEEDCQQPGSSASTHHGLNIEKISLRTPKSCTSAQEKGPRSRHETLKNQQEGPLHYFSSSSRALLFLVVLSACISATGGWIALSSDGYTMKHNLIAEAGLKVEGDVRVNGVLISRPSHNLECTAERVGSVRWNDKFFETCDGVHDWQPATFCSRTCDVNAQSVPCGLTVRNKCGMECPEMAGTGLNMRQCMLNVASTPCSQEVRDMCGNECGLQGQFACSSSPAESGGLFLRALEGTQSTAAFELQVGGEGVASENREALFLTYWDVATGEQTGLTIIRPLRGDVEGLEFSKPEGQEDATMRVSMFAELTGEHVQLGKNARDSLIYVDGVIDKECPLVMDGGNEDANLTRLCLETPTEQRTLTFPDATGTVITSGNREDISALRGLGGDDTMIFSGRFRDLGDIVPPRPPRLTCAADACANRTIPGTGAAGCLDLDYLGAEFDVFRLYYAFVDFGGNDLIRMSPAILAHLAGLNASGASRMDLAIEFLRLQEQTAGQRSMTDAEWAALRRRQSWGEVTGLEECFVCCCGAKENASATCPPPRTHPHFCVGGDRDGSVCSSGAECGGGGSCVHDPSMSCFEHDHGFDCYDLTQRPNFTTTLNFTASTDYRRLVLPDASGTIISTGNLEDLTSMGVLTAPLVGRATNVTTTTLQFERCFDAECGQQQVSSVLANNTLLMPSTADGILLTTGNLEDVTLDSGSVTGLRIATDLHVNGLLRFGDDALTSGIRLPPREPSVHYARPHGGQTPGNLQPGQLLLLVDESSLVLEFEPRRADDPEQVSYLTVPAADGTVVTTGNLEAVSREAGALTSLSVGGSSYLEGGLTVGLDGGPRLLVRGERSGALIFRDVANETTGEEAVTTLRFQAQPQSQAELLFPAASGTVITTGNLPDLSSFSGQQLNVSGAAQLRGPVTLGSDGATPVIMSGYLEGDVLYRGSPRFPGEDAPVTPPNTWDTRASTRCANPVPGPAAEDPLATFPLWSRFDVDPAFAELRLGTESFCKSRALGIGAGLVVRSRYLLAMVQSASNLQYLGVVPLDTEAARDEDHECYWPTTNSSSFVNFTDLPHLRTQWTRTAQCQAARSLGYTADGAQWGADLPALLGVEVLPVRCGNVPCTDMSRCETINGRACQVVIRSHATGAFLGVAGADKCRAYMEFGRVGTPGSCVSWEASPSLWQLQNRPAVAAFEEANTNFFTMRRDAVCVEASEADGEQVLACQADEDSISRINFVVWGQAEGVCGAYADAGGRHCGNGTREDLEEAIEAACVPGGCRVWLEDGTLYLRGRYYDGAWGANRTIAMDASCAGLEGVRLTLQATCRRSVYAQMQEREGGGVLVTTQLAEASVVQLHSLDYNKNTLDRECWVVQTPGPNCVLARDEELDVHWYQRSEATRLSFAVPTDARTQWLPDASGTIISTGNLEDITALRGLKGSDTFIYQHGSDPGDPVTIVDFAAIGTAPDDRVDGPLPDYALPDGTPAHPRPIGPNKRITFPDATGTVITTGNTDDLVFKSIQLQGLEMQVEANFGDESSDPTYVNFGPSSRISGCFNFVHNEDDAEYTQLCAVPASQNNLIILPDESGTVLTTGNLLNLPSIRIPDAHFFVGGDATFEGKMQFGMATEVTTLQLYTWVDGDVGMTFSGAGALKANRLQLNVPYMGGVDRAIRGYLSERVKLLAVNVQGGAAFRSPVANTSRINQTVCFDLLSAQGVEEFHDLGHFLLAEGLVRKTLLEGTPYGAFLLSGSPHSPLCRHNLTNVTLCTEAGVCRCPADLALPGVQLLWGARPEPCHGSGWDCTATLRACTGAGEPACAFDDNVSSTFRNERPAGIGLVDAVDDSLVIRVDCGWVQIQDPNAPLPEPECNASGVAGVVTGCNATVVEDGGGHEPAVNESVAGTCALGNTSNASVACDVPLTCRVVSAECLMPNCSMVNGSLVNCTVMPNCSVANSSTGLPSTGLLSCADPVCYWGNASGGNLSVVNCSATNCSDPRLPVRCSAPVCTPVDPVLDDCAIDDTPVNCTLVHGTLLCNATTNRTVANETTYPIWRRRCTESRLRVQQEVEAACVIGKRFSTPRQVSLARVLPHAGRGGGVLGGRLEATRDLNGVDGWESLYQFELSLSEAGWNQVQLQVPDGALYYHVRYVSAACVLTEENADVCQRCDGLELEWHEGEMTATLTPIEGGQSSAFVDELRVQEHPAGASVLKCASQRWYPNYLRLRSQELMMPETSGVLLTTGNLRDITKEAGSVSSLGVDGEVVVAGSTQIGVAGGSSQLEVNAQLEGRFPLAFSESGGSSSVLTLHVPDPTFDNMLHFPDASGTIVTSGSLPTVMEQLVVTGDTEIRGPVAMDGNVQVGDPLAPSTLELNSAIASAFPLSFSGSSPANPALSLGVEDPTGDRLLVLPDVSGTIVTTGNLPELLDSTVFTGEAVFRGGASLLGDRVVLGQREGEGDGTRTNLEVHAVMSGGRPLQLEGAAQDRRTLSLAVEEPSGHNVITLPDVTGTVITTGNFPDVVETLTVLGDAELEGEVSLVGPSVRLGSPERPGRVEINAVITGRYPLVFSDAAEGEAWAGSTTFEITPPTSSNIISFPDVSGTVITTANLPTTVILPEEDYTIQARSLVVRADSVAFGARAAPPAHSGAFVFTDGADTQGPEFGSKRDNSFNVRATGGVKLVTGHTTSGRELGVVLEAGASAWSVLSDRESKEQVQAVDEVEVLRRLVDGVPVSRWRYEGGAEEHMGPMAQDWHEAFGLGDGTGESISTVDADGVALAALQGLYRLHGELEKEVAGVAEEAARVAAAIEGNRVALRAQEEELHEQERTLRQLLRMLGADGAR